MFPGRLKGAIAIVGILGVAAPMGFASADGGDQNDPPPMPVPEEPEITAVVTPPGSTSPGTPATPEPVGCDWFAYDASDADAETSTMRSGRSST